MKLPKVDPSKSWVYYLTAAVILLAVLLGFAFKEMIGEEGGAEPFPLSLFIIAAAILGSLLNESSRAVSLNHPSFSERFGYISWKLGVAIVFAFFLYFLFIAGLVQGDLFPQFKNVHGESGRYSNMAAFATEVEPATNKDAAKVLVWSFVSGYSEKFVPNLLAKLTRNSEE